MAEMYFLGNSTKGQMFGSVIKTDNKTLVIDGGTKGDYTYLGNFLKEKTDGHVDAWFFTHAHQDHIGAFVNICKEMPEIAVDKILSDFPEFDMLMELGGRAEFEIELWKEFYGLINGRFSKSCHRVKRGEYFDFEDIRVNVLRTFNKDIIKNYVNNSSCVYMIESERKKVLILGDLGIEGGRELMEMYDEKSLYSDYIQLSHHGQNGVDEEFYKYVKPKACLWPTPSWLWDNDNGGGFDSGPWATLKTRRWMEELGVKEHIIAKDGTTKILL